MRNLNESAEITEKLSSKVLKMLDKLDDAEAFAVLNYCFTKMLVQRMDDPYIMKAAMLTFIANTNTSIDRAFEIAEMEDEHIH